MKNKKNIFQTTSECKYHLLFDSVLYALIYELFQILEKSCKKLKEDNMHQEN